MRKTIIILLSIFSFCSFLTACNKDSAAPEAGTDVPQGVTGEQEALTNESLSGRSACTVTFYTMPSPPAYKIIENRELVQKIWTAVERAQKTPIDQAQPAGGWELYLHFSNGTQVSLLGSELQIDDQRYTVDSSLKTQLLALYERSESPEQEVSQ